MVCCALIKSEIDACHCFSSLSTAHCFKSLFKYTTREKIMRKSICKTSIIPSLNECEVIFRIPTNIISKEYIRKRYFKSFKIFTSGLKKNYH